MGAPSLARLASPQQQQEPWLGVHSHSWHGRNVWLAAVQTIMYLRYGSKTATTYVEKLSGRAQRTAS
eukprot:SAG25_NODE_6073_length_591_cov_1.599593_1_plen_67_part_00